MKNVKNEIIEDWPFVKPKGLRGEKNELQKLKRPKKLLFRDK